ncbi:M23 family metallopeptidase [Antrihabitans sp. YC2-6]|uniref:M23 family metallopeptidase n=1 Tax=Antrihabitans sp. YC2-6 TaxID=2799498 RepID=UPI0018F2F109|nr:M23 family metallopeptidase [Antrihabitans sp. YC2-6]MBJ8343272.1 M23 family metallopeptidase [Antrihabitans sp. YC2-6]
MNRSFRGAALVLGTAACLVIASCSDSDSSDSETTATSGPSTTSEQPPEITPMIGSVVAPPIPVTGANKRTHMAYELFLTNLYTSPVTVKSVKATAGGKTLQEITGADLETWMRVYGATAPGAVLGPGQSAVVWIDATVENEADVPDRIEHVIDIDIANPDPPLIPPTLSETIAPVEVDKTAPVVIAPPLDGPHWTDANGCCIPTPHRTAMNPINGQFRVAERFAIDWVQLDDAGLLFTGDKTKVESYAYFGDNVHAVADGEVVAVVNDLPEQVPGASPTGLPLDQYGGNHIVQDIGDGHFVLYAHLQPGDGVKVKVGDQLSTGQVIGLLGNSGNTDAPHLHFHVMDGPDPLNANGLPFEFAEFELESRLASEDTIDTISDGGKAEYDAGVATGPRTDELPLFLDVMKLTAGE